MGPREESYKYRDPKCMGRTCMECEGRELAIEAALRDWTFKISAMVLKMGRGSRVLERKLAYRIAAQKIRDMAK